MNDLKKYWVQSTSDLIESYEVDFEKGLSSQEALERKKTFGLNVLRTKAKVKAWEILLRQLKSIIVFLLLSAAFISLFLSQYVEALSIFFVILANTIIGFFTEYRAVRSMESLRKMGITSTKVLRDQHITNVDARELVPGDIVYLEGGDIVTADIRLIESAGVMCDESTFSGESLATEKFDLTVDGSSSILERRNTLFKGTSVLRGSAKGIVVATGPRTELGKIAQLTDEAQEELTPLEKRLEDLGKKLIKITLIIAVVIVLSGIWAGHEISLMFKVSIALAVAAIPEGLPIVATIALAKGMMRMAKNNALINKLSAVETLGATTVIFTDKTGTLTENKMQVSKFQLRFGEVQIEREKDSRTQAFFDSKNLNQEEQSIFLKALKIGALCNNASLKHENQGEHVGDTMEVALLQVAKEFGLSKNELLKKYPKTREEAFSFEERRMATVHKTDTDRFFFALKGAPEAIIHISKKVLTKKGLEVLSDKEKQDWLSDNERLAAQGHRVLALAYKETPTQKENPYEDAIFLGLVCFRDPPRADIHTSIRSCLEAGISPIMVTGDQSGTALSIAKEIGLIDDDYQEGVLEGRELEGFENNDLLKEKMLKTRIFSRVTPKQKLELISIYQKRNNVVSMTGDGVNDAPALKKADIGVAMGLRGTQVAKEASDMVLKDDSFSSIVKAIYQGRIIFNNIKLFVVYLLSCNISEIFIVSTATIFHLPLPLMPLQILFLNLVTDVFPALALGMGEGDSSYAYKYPRDPSKPIVGQKTWVTIFTYGVVLTTSVLTAFLLGLFFYKFETREALTVSFLTLGIAQVLHVFNMRSARSSLWKNEVTKNIHVWGSVVFCFILLLGVVYFPAVSDALELTPPSLEQWGIITLFSTLPLILIQLSKLLWKYLGIRSNA